MILTPVSLESERDKLRYAIARHWRQQGKLSWTDQEMDSEVNARLARLYPRKAEQLTLPGVPVEPKPPAETAELSTKAAAFDASQRNSGIRRNQVYDLLDRAGSRGLTREEIADALELKEAWICQAVKQLVDSGEACEPTKRPSKAGVNSKVVVLARHWRPS